MNRQMPEPLWIAIVFLGAMVLGKIAAVGEAGPRALVDAALLTVFLVGLVRGREWAYVLTILAATGGTMWGAMRGIHAGWSILAIDGLVLVPVLLCTDYYFPQRPLQRPPGRVNHSTSQTATD